LTSFASMTVEAKVPADNFEANFFSRDNLKLLRDKLLVLNVYCPLLSKQRGLFLEYLIGMYKPRYKTYPQNPIQHLLILPFIEFLGKEFGLVTSRELVLIRDGYFRKPEASLEASGKYKTWDEVVKRADELHNMGGKVGLVHGAFDPPHMGHARLSAKVGGKQFLFYPLNQGKAKNSWISTEDLVSTCWVANSGID